MKLVSAGQHELRKTLECEPGQPLWKVVPTRDENGKLLIDFVMWIPRLKRQSPDYIQTTLVHIHAVLQRYQEVVFADMNLAINVLWVSLKHRPGIVREVFNAIHALVPEAKLVAQQMEQ
jgi:hypothetical protein